MPSLNISFSAFKFFSWVGKVRMLTHTACQLATNWVVVNQKYFYFLHVTSKLGKYFSKYVLQKMCKTKLNARKKNLT